MSRTAASRLLASIFAGARAAELFTVLRNGERLPGSLAGHDLDVSTMPGRTPADVVAFLVERGRAAGFTAACVSRRPHMIAVSFVSAVTDGGAEAVHFDVFDGITFACIDIVPAALLARASTVRDGVRSLDPRGRMLATLAHHLPWTGGLTKAKYREELASLLADPADRDWLLRELVRIFGARIADEARSPATLGTDFGPRRRAVRAALLRRALRTAPLATAGAVARYIAGQVPTFSQPPGMVARDGARLEGGVRLDLALACRLAPHAFAVDAMRARNGARTLNGPRYERTLARTWSRGAIVRWIAPSLFLWYQAKRGRVVLVDRLPAGLRLLRRVARPAWLPAPAVSPARETGVRAHAV